jgi:hypothetical protein
MADIETASADFDDGADTQIRDCLNPVNPQSFFLYAGAGSGKTRSLKNALDTFREDHGTAFRRSGKKIAVITYTNAAVDEIAERVGEDPLFPISTIHSFCWKHIGPTIAISRHGCSRHSPSIWPNCTRGKQRGAPARRLPLIASAQSPLSRGALNGSALLGGSRTIRTETTSGRVHCPIPRC